MNNERINQLISEGYTDGTLCYGCGELNKSLIGEDKILKTPGEKPYLCKKCKKEFDRDKQMDTGYLIKFKINKNFEFDTIFTFLLEQGFSLIDNQEDGFYV